MKTILVAAVSIALALAAAVSSPTAPPTAPPAANAAPTGTVKVTTPGVTVNFGAQGSVTSAAPVQMPAGTYHPSVKCFVQVEKDGAKETYSIHGGPVAKSHPTVEVKAGEVTTVQAGPPLVAKVTLSPVRQRPATSQYDPGGRYIDIGFEVIGQGGEAYRFFNNNSGQAWPTFLILDAAGKEIGKAAAGFG